jgi:hypothetical protein
MEKRNTPAGMGLSNSASRYEGLMTFPRRRALHGWVDRWDGEEKIRQFVDLFNV